jgi:hypothetical protein
LLRHGNRRLRAVFSYLWTDSLSHGPIRTGARLNGSDRSADLLSRSSGAR